MFSLLVVVTAAATRPVFGELIIDPVHTVARLDNVYAVILGALTFMIATVGINIVANFVSPAFDFSNVNPQKISWRMGGMIAAVGSVLITPWNLYNSPDTIHYTLDTLGAFIGPLYGVLIADYYLVKRRRVVVDDLYTLNADGQLPLQEGLQPDRDRRHRDLRGRRDDRGVLRLLRGRHLHLVHRRRPGLRPVHGRQPALRRQGQLPRRPQTEVLADSTPADAGRWAAVRLPRIAGRVRGTGASTRPPAPERQTPSMLIKVINPNTTGSMTEKIGECARTGGRGRHH